MAKTYGHSGFFPGYMTDMMYWPDAKIAVAVQVNTSEFQKVKPRLTQWAVELGGRGDFKAQVKSELLAILSQFMN